MSRNFHARPRVRASIAITSLWLLAGCVNLEEVVGLARIAMLAERKLPALSNDIGATCIRRSRYHEDLPDNEKPPGDVAIDCEPYKDVSRRLAQDEKVLIEYFEALGQLASNTPLSYGKTIDANTAAIGKIPKLDAPTATATKAAESIAKALADAATNGYRKREVNQLIKKNDAAVQELVGALDTIMTGDYRILLDNEETDMKSFYESPLAKPGSERLALILVQRQYEGDKARLEAHRESIEAFSKVMKNLGTVHAKLKEEADKKASMVQIAKDLGPTISSLKDSIATLE